MEGRTRGTHLTEVPFALTGKVYPPVREGQWGEGAGGYLFVWNNDARSLGVTIRMSISEVGLCEVD